METIIERRFTACLVEVRGNEARRSIGGYAAKFNKPSSNLGGFIERVAPAAFNGSRGRDWPNVRARYNHDPMMLLGTTAAGTLRLAIDDVGLLYEVDPPQSRSDVLELVERRDIQHSSFAFRMVNAESDEWGTSDQGYPMRTLLNVGLVDVAPVGEEPAYPDATAGLRSLATKFDADLEEVRSLAQADELRKFFVRTDLKGRVQTPKTLGAAARMALLGKEQDPWA
jgi:HK97 family phage prohead protease